MPNVCEQMHKEEVLTDDQADEKKQEKCKSSVYLSYFLYFPYIVARTKNTRNILLSKLSTIS